MTTHDTPPFTDCQQCVYHQETNRCVLRKGRIAKALQKISLQKDWTPFVRYKTHTIFDRDVGGGGDCLFYCLGHIYRQYFEHILVRPSERQRALYEKIEKQPLLFRTLIGELFTASFLKKTARAMILGQKSVEKKAKEAFLQSFYTEIGFWLKLGFDDGDAKYLATHAESVEQAVRLAHQRKKRSCQWGGEFDIAQFEKLTNIGIWIISPTIEAKKKKLFYCTTASKIFPCYAFLRSIDQFHYTVAGIQETRHSPISSVWKTKQLPPWIIEKMTVDCPKLD